MRPSSLHVDVTRRYTLHRDVTQGRYSLLHVTRDVIRRPPGAQGNGSVADVATRLVIEVGRLRRGIPAGERRSPDDFAVGAKAWRDVTICNGMQRYVTVCNDFTSHWVPRPGGQTFRSRRFMM